MRNMLDTKAKYREEYLVDSTWRSLASDPMKILGAYFGYDDNLVRQKIFQICHNKMKFGQSPTSGNNVVLLEG